MKSDKYNIQTHNNNHSTKQRGELKKTHPSHPESKKAHHYTHKEEKKRITFFSSRQNEKLKKEKRQP